MNFYRETKNLHNFKDTEIGKIPKEWKVVRLRDVLNLLRNGLVAKQNKDGKGIAITRIETISEERIDVEKVGYIEEISEKEIAEYRLRHGDILFSHINSLEHIGKTAIYNGDPPLLLHGMNLLLLRPQKTIVNPYYLLYLLKHPRAKAIFKRMSKKAVNQASINQTELGKLRIPLPPLSEQKKIAEILSTVDEAIEKVDEAITKTERLKKGLMQELLTKGIGHMEFKDTEIGKIPKEWEVVKLIDAADYINGYAFSPKDWKDEGLPIIRIQNLNDPEAEFNYFDGEIDNRYIVENGDLLFSWSATIGVYIWKGGKAVLNQHIFKVVPKNNVNKFYLYYALFLAIEQLKNRIHGSTMKHFKRGELKTAFIPLPPLPEQQKIAEILSTVDKRLELLKSKKEKLLSIKKGLINDLLIGRRRVRL